MTPTRTLGVLALTASILWPAALQAQDSKPATEKGQPFLWKVEGQKTSYLFGTVHLPDKRVVNLPKVVTNAIDGVDGVFCEVPMDMASQMKVQGMTMLPAGKSLDKEIPADLYKRADAILSKKGIPLRMLNRMKPWVVAMQMTYFDYLKELRSGTQPMDKSIYMRGEKAGKEVGGLETHTEQLGALEGIDQVYFFRKTVEEMEKAEKEGIRPAEPLLKIYITGDLEKLHAFAKKEMDPSDPMSNKFNKLLIVDRNIRMADRIHKKLALGDKSYFFAIGALHYPGQKGILALLRAKGYKVTRVSDPKTGKQFR